MKILNLDARAVNQSDVALPFTTDDEVVAAWNWLLENRYLDGFSYRPRSEGADVGRGFLNLYFGARQNSNTALPSLEASHIRVIIESLYQDDMPHSVRDLIDPAA